MHQLIKKGNKSCRNFVKKAGFCTILCIMLLILPIDRNSIKVQAAAQDAPVTVKVGYFYNGDFMHKEDDGTYAGYDIEYYETLAGYANWNIEFVDYDNLQDALKGLQDGDIDILSGLAQTAERQELYLSSGRKMCTSHIAVQTRADNDRIAAGDVKTMAQMTCGILKGSNVIQLYEKWCADNQLTPHIIEYNSLQERNTALEAGEVDAIAGGSTLPGAQRIAEFPGLDLYFMLNRKQGALQLQLNRAMEVLSLQDSTYEARLFEKYFPASRNTAPSFSRTEKQYIAQHQQLRVAMLRSNAPFSSLTDTEMEGILPQYYDHLGQVTGLHFTFVPFDTTQEACEALSAGKVDLVAQVENNIFQAQRQHYILTKTYMELSLVQITRAGTEQVSTAAVPEEKDTMIRSALKNADLDVTTSHYQNCSQCMAALKAGKTDAVICTQPAAAWLLNRNRASDYVVTAIGMESWNTACAVAFTADGNILRSILNKTFSVDTRNADQLITDYTLRDSSDLAGFFDRLPIRVIAGLASIAVFLLLITSAALVVIIRRRKTEKRLALQQAQLAASEEVNRARHAFFGTISHDMRTPLNGIMGFTELAQKSSDPAEIGEYLQKIHRSGAILTELVNDTLVMSRMENGQYILKPSPHDNVEIIETVVESVSELAKEKQVNFLCDTAGMRRRIVMADLLSLQKVLINLLSNAIKFTKPGGTVTLTCRQEQHGDGPEETVLVVSDTGKGISKEFLPHVFEPFTQENAADQGNGGSGLGLSIVKSIVDSMGGSIHVESDQGKGTVFTVRLQLEELPELTQEDMSDHGEQGDQTGTAANAEHSAADRERILRGKHVLVCEDNHLNYEIIRKILEHSGMVVTGAVNGMEGLAAFQKSAVGEFSVILLDLRMPLMDGKTMARELRRLDRADAKEVPVYAVSADAYQENVEECLAAGMNGHIAKPINVELLLATMTKALEKQVKTL